MTRWSELCPHNFLGKQYLLEAELASVTRNDGVLRSKYASAIALSRESGFWMQLGIAHECAARHFDPSHHYDEARRAYMQWGSQAKVDHVDRLKMSHSP